MVQVYRSLPERRGSTEGYGASRRHREESNSDDLCQCVSCKMRYTAQHLKHSSINLTFRLFTAKSSSSSSSYPSYLGCLNLTASELEASWIFPGTAPACSYVHHSGSSGGGSGSSSSSSGSNGGSSSNGGSGSSSGSGGSNGGSSSGDGNGSSSNGDGSSSSGNNESGGDSSSNNGGDSSSSGSNASGGDSSNNNGGDSSSSGNNGSGGDSSNSNGGDSSASGYNGSGDNNSNNNAYNGNVDEGGRNYGDEAGNGYNSGGSGGNSGSTYGDEVVTNGDYVSGYGYNGQDDGNDGYNGYSGDSGNSPYSDFDIATCDTYENLWLWDFSLTCDDADNLESCECNFAEEMMDSGLLSCDAAAECPADCAICTTCFQVLGCATGGSGGLNSAKSATNFLYVIAAGAGVLFFGIVYYSANKKRGNQDLGTHLMEDEGSSGTGTAATSRLSPPVWLASNNEASPSEIPASNLPSSPVWLAPDAPPAQFEPSSHAAMESSGESSHETGFGAFIVPGILPVSSDESSDPEDDFPASSDLLSEPEANVWLAPLT
jgi:hypothetical protein